MGQYGLRFTNVQIGSWVVCWMVNVFPTEMTQIVQRDNQWEHGVHKRRPTTVPDTFTLQTRFLQHIFCGPDLAWAGLTLLLLLEPPASGTDTIA